MLSALHIQVVQKLVGMSPASFFEHTTSLSRMTYQRGRGYSAMIASREQVEAHADTLFLRMMRKRGATDAECQEIKSEIPSGFSALMVFNMGLLDEGCSPATRELVENFDASDLRLRRLSKTDVTGFRAELRPGSTLGLDYCAPLHVSGFRYTDLELDGYERGVHELALTYRANMALSFLAAVDHEIGRWNVRVFGTDAMEGRPRFGVLLANPASKLSARSTPQDPLARLVDYVGAVGHRARTGDWPRAVPTIAEMGAQTELSRAATGNGARFVRGLRSGKHRMTRSAFRTLIRSQFERTATLTSVTDAAADLLEPYLVAAQLLTLLMPDHPVTKHHLDRTGWREAYLDWWARHARRYPPSASSSHSGPPDWLLNP